MNLSPKSITRSAKTGLVLDSNVYSLRNTFLNRLFDHPVWATIPSDLCKLCVLDYDSCFFIINIHL